MVTDKQILEALQARNFDIREVARALKIRLKKVERVYDSYRKTNRKDDIARVTPLVENNGHHNGPGISGMSPDVPDNSPDPCNIEKDFIRKSYDLKMKALNKIEILLNTETDLAKLSTVLRTLDGITSERDIPGKPGGENEFFNIPKT